MTTIKSDLSQTHRFAFTSIGQRAYLANGWDKMLMWDGHSASAEDAGIPLPPQDWAPSPSAASGNPEAGKHYFQYRYKDSVTGYVSDPSNLISATTTAGNTKLTFAVNTSGTGNINTSSDGKVDKILLESTLVEGSVFYIATEVDNSAGNAVFNLSDASLSEYVLPHEDTGNAQPPYFRALVSHKGRLWGLGSVRHNAGTVAVANGSATVTGTSTLWTEAAVGRYFNLPAGSARSYEVLSRASATSITLTENWAGATGSGLDYVITSKAPNLLSCSKALYPESWPVLSFIDTMKEMNDQATALIPLGNQLLILGTHSIERLTFSLEPFISISGRQPDGQLFPISSTRGSFNPHTVKEVEGKIYGWDKAGIWVFSGGQPQHISRPVDYVLKTALTNYGGKDKSPHMSWHGGERKLRFHYGLTSYNITDFVELEVDTGQWSTGTHFTSMLCSAEYSDPIHGQTAIYGDSLGYMWMPDSNSKAMGVQLVDYADTMAVATVVGTVDASGPPTSTVFTITEGSLDNFSSIYPADASFTGMGGTPCYSVGLDETAIIESNTATVVTLLHGFSTAPAVGSKIYFGTINSSLLSRQFTLDDEWDITEPRYVHLYFNPLSVNSTNTIFLQLYTNGLAYTGWVTRSENGISFTTGESKIRVLVDLSGTGVEGYRKIPIGSQSSRYLAVRLGTDKPNETAPAEMTWPIITRIDIDGYTSESPVDVK